MSQGGANVIPAWFYERALQPLPDIKSICNLGSGEVFSLEALAHERGAVSIAAYDMTQPKSVPPYVNFHTANVEEPIDFDQHYEVVTFFEVIEHIDRTDGLLRNCYNALSDSGTLVLSVPNLASVFGRLELLFGFQPHVLEVSNECGTLGSGVFGRLNNPSGGSIHHIRGFTSRAIKQLLAFHGFDIEAVEGSSFTHPRLFRHFPSLAPQLVIHCRKRSIASADRRTS